LREYRAYRDLHILNSAVRKIAVVALLSWLYINAVAANNDSPVTPLTAKADSMVLNRHTGIQTLSGNVVIVQDEFTIQADLIQVTTSNGAIEKIYGTGAPIRFTQLLEDGSIIQTESKEIEYVTRRWLLHFSGNVVLQRGNWKIVSNSVAYNVRNKGFEAGGWNVTDGNESSAGVSYSYSN